MEGARLQKGQDERHVGQRLLRVLAVGGIVFSLLILGMLVARLQRENRERRTNEQRARDQIDLAHAARRDMEALGRYAGLLQSCRSYDEALSVSEQALSRMMPDLGGALYLVQPSRDYAERMFTWGALPSGTHELAATDECWSMRRGHPYAVDSLHRDVKCSHIELPPPDRPATSLCVPMTVQGESLGFLYVARTGEGPMARAPLAEAAAEQLALALFNLRLQDQLRVQSIRDPLTGLFNRRYLEESLARELARAQRRQAGVAVLMIDVDHFKRFNDDHGHEAGDDVLRKVGALLVAQCRAEDVACRYGGEEFTIILPEVDLDTACLRAEQIRQAVERLQPMYLGRELPPVTVSVGIALFPGHALRPEGMLRCADAALYAAKKAGRNRVEVGTAGC